MTYVLETDKKERPEVLPHHGPRGESANQIQMGGSCRREGARLNT